MNKIIFLLHLIFLSFNGTFAQTGAKKDTTIVLKNDDYSNFSRSDKVSPRSETIAFDTIGQNPGMKSEKIILIAFDYQNITGQAELQYKKKQFQKAIELYTTAFVKNNDLGLVKHRYNLACCYVNTNNIDSAFIQLFRIAGKGKYFNYSEIENESCLKSLHNDKRWTQLIEIMRSNAKKLEDEINSKTPENN